MIPPLARGQLVTLKSTGLTYTAAGGRGEKPFEVLFKFIGLKLEDRTAQLDDIIPLDTDPLGDFEPLDDGSLQLMSGGPAVRIKPTDTQPPNGKLLYSWMKAGKEVVRPIWPEMLRPALRIPKTRKPATPYQVAGELATQLANDGRLPLVHCLAQIEERYGFPHVFFNSNGNLTISDDLLAKLQRLCPEGTLWEEATKEWRIAKR